MKIKKEVKVTKTKIKSNKIKKYLTELEMEQKDLAKKCNVSSEHISEIVTGKRKGITLSLAAKISKALKQPIENIFTL